MAALPPPRTPGGYRLGVVCLGNICRSPMAHVVLESALDDAGLSSRVAVASSGTGDWHVGNPMDRRAAATLTAHGYDATRHRARQFDPSWFETCDVVLAMDRDNLADLERLLPGEAEEGRLLLFREFDPRAEGGDREVPDPYYGGDEGFEIVLGMVRRTSREIVRQLGSLLS